MVGNRQQSSKNVILTPTAVVTVVAALSNWRTAARVIARITERTDAVIQASGFWIKDKRRIGKPIVIDFWSPLLATPASFLL